MSRSSSVRSTNSSCLSTSRVSQVSGYERVNRSDAIRDYRTSDETSWLRCRVLAFLDTAYYDDVWTAKPRLQSPGFELVTVHDATVVGILDVDVDGPDATIDTIAVHPDHQRNGLGNAMLERARERCRKLGATALEAWTRDDETTLRWYRRAGFEESDHYLHVYADHYVSPNEPARAIRSLRPGLRPIKLFLHARIQDEPELRQQFHRLHTCRRFVQQL